MGKRSTGIQMLDLGETWRKIYLSGTPISQLALNTGKNMQDISRAIWLAKIPSDLKDLIRAHPEIFTRSILINSFAAKRYQCEKDGFALLRTEIPRLISLGAGAKPKLKKTNKSRKNKITKSQKNHSKAALYSDPMIDLNSALEAEHLLKQALGFSCRVIFDKKGEGEVRIFFQNKKALSNLIEMIYPR